MARSLNRVTLIGALGRDPEVRRMQDGTPVVNLRMATSESWKDKASGEWKEATEWHAVVLFGEGLAKVAEPMRKGSKLTVEGQLKTRKWTDQGGTEKYTTEIVLRGPTAIIIVHDAPTGDRGSRGSADRNDSGSSGASSSKSYDLGGDDLPF